VTPQLQDRGSRLEQQVANDLATHHEADDFKKDSTDRLNRIEDKLDQELSYHRRHY